MGLSKQICPGIRGTALISALKTKIVDVDGFNLLI